VKKKAESSEGKNKVLFLTIKSTKMDCKSCIENLDAYQGGKLTPGTKTQVESHLEKCEACSHVYNVMVFVERVIDYEKKTEHGPFLATRIMAGIENRKAELLPETGTTRILRPVFISLSLAAALFAGIILGKWSVSSGIQDSLPFEIAMIDDNSLESVYLLSNE